MVEDNADAVELLEVLLRLHGFEVVSTDNVMDALELVSDSFDAVCTDLSMPGMDGFAFIRSVRNAKAISIPIVVVSGQEPELVRDRAHELGCCRFLSKPCDPDRLVQTLHFLIDNCIADCSLCTLRRSKG